VDTTKEICTALNSLEAFYQGGNSWIAGFLYTLMETNLRTDHHHFVEEEKRLDLETPLRFFEKKAKCIQEVAQDTRKPTSSMKKQLSYPPCPYCSDPNHPLCTCPEFRNMSVMER
jgi:hypothetical protein